MRFYSVSITDIIHFAYISLYTGSLDHMLCESQTRIPLSNTIAMQVNSEDGNW